MDFTQFAPDLDKIPPLPQEVEQFLRQQKIDENSPGSILQDFQMLLEFVGKHGIEVSGVNHFLPTKLLGEINARLTKPIQIDLKRPQQKSYPPIQGLYLLLRSSGLAYVTQPGQKKKLVLDEAVLQSWQQLNPTERYLTLLEIWSIWASDEIIGEYSPFPNIFRCAQFWASTTEKKWRITKRDREISSFSYLPGLHNLALLDLFGAIAIEPGKPEAGKGWRFTQISKTPFGEAMMQVLVRAAIPGAIEAEMENSRERNYGLLQSSLQPFFPEWQNTLVIPRSETIEGVYLFKVSLGSVWRRIAMPSHLTLEPLVNSILKAFNFDKDHLYQFICKDRFGGSLQISHPYVEDSPRWTDEFKVEELPLSVGETMIFWFDFGDDWKFDVLLEEIQPPNKKLKQPKLLESHGKAPPQYWCEEDEDWDGEDAEE